MNLEIANRLVQLRKEHHLSQEELAEKIGISRQAVSKWERAESSPDTDNLILLSQLYHMSIDELLKTNVAKDNTNADAVSNVAAGTANAIETAYIPQTANVTQTYTPQAANTAQASYTDQSANETQAANENQATNEHKPTSAWMKFPYPVLVTIIYLIIGSIFNKWHPGWVVFLTIPIYYWLVEILVPQQNEQDDK